MPGSELRATMVLLSVQDSLAFLLLDFTLFRFIKKSNQKHILLRFISLGTCGEAGVATK